LILDLGDSALDLSARTHVMGILNITPDSFSDGGKFLDPVRAEARALEMIEEGADIIDIGGESTRPGAEPVSVEEELGRVIPVIEHLAPRIDVPISIDTYKAVVAREALRAGARIVNDISGLRFDPEMADVVAAGGAAVVLMHIKGRPRDMQKNPVYEDLLGEIADYLSESISIAERAGVSPDRIVVDPGIGFGKTFDHNLEIIRRLGELDRLGKPVLVGPSRKAFVGKILGDLPPEERVEGTAAVVALAIASGAHIVRVHDVKTMVRVARVADAVRRGRIA